MSTFGAVIGARSDEGREEYLRYYKAAIEVPSPAITVLNEISKNSGIFLVVGVVERDGGTLYCAVVFIDPEDGLVGKHRKLIPTGTERLIWGMGDVSTLTTVEKDFSVNDTSKRTRLAATICWYVFLG